MTVDIYLVQSQNGHFLKAKNQNSVAVTCIFGIIIPVNHTFRCGFSFWPDEGFEEDGRAKRGKKVSRIESIFRKNLLLT
jgi:hypothetical protein